MSYANRSITSLLRGPLLHTPQGLVVLVVLAVHLALLPFVHTGSISLLGKSSTTGMVICLSWPLITCLYFIREGVSTTPEFKPSVPRALWILLIGMAPTLWPFAAQLLAW